MVKRFSLVLQDHDYYAFMQAFPDYGERTKLLRQTVRQLVKRAKVVSPNGQVTELADSIFDGLKGD